MTQEMTPAQMSAYMEYPIQTPPPGVIPNFEDPDSTAYQLYITAGFCIGLMLVFTFIRFASRVTGRKEAVSDEIVFLAGLFFCLFFICMTIACVSGGAFGKQAWNVLLGAFTKSQLVLALLVEIFGPVGICLVKVSVLLLYLRLFGLLRWMKILAIGGIVIMSAWHLALSIAFAVMCSPSSGDSQVDFLTAFVSNSCTDTRVLIVIQGVGNVFFDLYLLVLPLPAVWALQMPLKRKLAISSMFLVGIAACVSSIIGLYYRVQFYTAGQNNIRVVVPVWCTAIAEEAAGVMICCMPSTAAGFKALTPSMKSWMSSASQRLTGSSRSGMGGSKHSLSSGSSESGYRHGSMERKSESSGKPIVWHPGTRGNRPAAWAGSEHDSSLEQLRDSDYAIGMRTEYEVSRAV